MLKQYKNLDEILNADKSISGNRIQEKSRSLLSYPLNNRIEFNPSISPGAQLYDYNNQMELHVYSDQTWISGEYDVPDANSSPPNSPFFDTDLNTSINFPSNWLNIPLYDEFKKLQITSGQFRFVINFFKNCIGSYNQQYLKVDEISPDRTEIRLKAIDKKNSDFLSQINDYINNVQQTSLTGFSKTYLLNFSRNQCFKFVNSVVIGEYLYVKLADPIDDIIEEQFKCWVVEELKYPYIDNVVLYEPSSQIGYIPLQGPNWQANTPLSDTSAETNLKSWNDLLGSSVQTSQEIIDAYFSGSLHGVKPNIDYTDFNNFIFYSSATERLKNFKYKLELVELYTSQSSVVSLLSGSNATTNIADYNSKKSKLIGGFDDFEKFMYYQSSSGLFSHEIPSIEPNVDFFTGSYITPAPKTNTTYPYTLYSISSSAFETWYDNLIVTSSKYDRENQNAIIKSIPEFIRFDRTNTQLAPFVNMLGQHYDILHTYIKTMTLINSREEHPDLGMPNELLYSVAKQFGWNLSNGNQSKNLWEYTLGTSEAGIPLTGSNSIGKPAVSNQDMTYHIWRRIVNNLPGLLKSKGTKRSIQSLLACYGVPQSLITIKEYGGPRIERAPIYEKLNFDYALDLIRNPAGTVTTTWGADLPPYKRPQAVELRFRTDNVLTNPTMSGVMNLYTINATGSEDIFVDVAFSRGTLGKIRVNGTASAEIECFDGNWVNTVLENSGSELKLTAKKSKYGKIVATVTSSYNHPQQLLDSGSITFGSSSTAGVRLEGELQEFRLWEYPLENMPFENHTKAPGAYDGNTNTYNELIYRLPLNQKINHTTIPTIQGVQPVSSSISSSFRSWTNDSPYSDIEEMYYYDGISIGAGTFDDNKVRLESNNLVGTLDLKTRAERSQFDKSPLDSKKLGVYYSPQTMINEDVIAQLGFTSLDNFIGDPGDQDSNAYPDLIRVAEDYWKKYIDKNDMNAYIKIFSMFDLSFFRQLDQLLPARVDKITGLLIQPNILERSKGTVLPTISNTLDTFSDTIQITKNSLTSSYDVYNGQINRIISASGNDDDQYQAMLTSSSDTKFDGTQYCYPEIIRSGSSWLTVTSSRYCEAVTPYISSSRVSEIYQLLYSETPASSTSTSSFKEFPGNGSTRVNPYEPGTEHDWINPNNITSGGDTFSEVLTTEYSDVLHASSWSWSSLLSISDAGNLLGLEVDVEAKTTTQGYSVPYTASLYSDHSSDINVGENKGVYTPGLVVLWPTTSQSTKTYGGPDDTWGLTSAELYSALTGTNRMSFGFQFYQGLGNSTITVSKVSMKLYYMSGSVSTFIYRDAEIQDFTPAGTANLEYNGCQMTSPDFNIASADTVDGGPVVEIIPANPNTVVVQGGGSGGTFVVGNK
tara:strand:+ start:14372 stop:18511 length:4140 start_codon:yes stop_codon:yes gene_type:complete